MRIVFIGVISIGWHCLKTLLELEADVVGVFTVDKQSILTGSGMSPEYFYEFDELSQQHGFSLYKLSSVNELNTEENVELAKSLHPDLVFCIGWPGIVKKEILAIPTNGCIGVHPTLLPDRRGGAPVNWTLIDGLSTSGVTLFYFDSGLDSGDIIAQQVIEIDINDTSRTYLEKVTQAAVQLIQKSYPLLSRGKAPRIYQDDSKATYTRRRRPEDGLIDWRWTSLTIYNWIRALTIPFPGAFSHFNGDNVVVWESQLLRGYRPSVKARPGEVLDIVEGEGLIIATGDGGILIKAVKMGDDSVSADEWARRTGIERGQIMERTL
jgi:methionyl-tRNA formyltransferase